MSEKYTNPPIIEAVCEFKLTPESKWDLTIPGFVYEKIKNDFPKKEQRFIKEMEITNIAGGLQHQIRTDERIFFLTNDGKLFIQLGRHILAVHCLKPYPTWSGFKPRIELAFRAITEIVDIKGIQRIGLRYINRIEILNQTVELDDYFEFRPFLGMSLPQNMNGFMLGCNLPFFDERDSCKVQLTPAVPEKPGTSSFLLDLDYFLNKPQAISVDYALEWVEIAHEKTEEIFEGCISDRLRATFQMAE